MPESEDLLGFLVNDLTQRRLINTLRGLIPLDSVELSETHYQASSCGMLYATLDYVCTDPEGETLKITLVVNARDREIVDQLSLDRMTGPFLGHDGYHFMFCGTLKMQDGPIQEQKWPEGSQELPISG